MKVRLNFLFILLPLIFINMMNCSFIYDHSENVTVFIKTVKHKFSTVPMLNGSLALLLPGSTDEKQISSCKNITPPAGLTFSKAAVLGIEKK